jgi:hypothetical protein
MASNDRGNGFAEWLAEELLTPARTFREQAGGDKSWPWYRQLVFGDHWDGTRLSVPPGYDKFQANIIMPTIDTVKGIALASPSVIEFAPMESSDEQLCRDLSSIIGDYLWNARKARFKLGVAFLEGAVIGTAWTKTFWNPRLLGGKGDVDFFVVPAEEVYVDPATPGPNEWQYIVHETRRPYIEVVHNDAFDEKARAEVTPDQAKKGENEPKMKLVTLYEYWLRGPYAKEALTRFPEASAGVDDAEAEKYGIVVTLAGDGTLLSVKEHPYRSDRFPFQRFVYYAPTGSQRVYGKGEAEFLEDIQVAVDARMMQMLNHAALIANGQWLISNGIVMDEEQLTSEPGKIIRVEGPVSDQFIRRIAPDNISGSLFSIVNMLLQFTQYISGMYDVNRGQNPGSIRAGVAIEALQRGGEGRTRQKMDNFDDFVADIALGMYDVMAAMYDDERYFRVLTTPEDVAGVPDEEAALAGFASKEEMVGKPRLVALSKDRLKRDGEDIVLDVRAQVGLMLRSPREQLQSDIELMQAGVVDAQYVIENNMLRGKEALLQRLMAAQPMAAPEGQQQAAMAEAQTGQPAPVTPGEEAQVREVIDMLLAKMQVLEEQGAIPRGTAEQVRSAVEAEIAAGGTGEVALQQALAMLQGGGAETLGVAGPPIPA